MISCPTCVDSAVTAFCRGCGKGVCDGCMERHDGVSYCLECSPTVIDAEPVAADVPLIAASPPPLPPPTAAATDVADGPHPLLAGLLGFVPGLGAVYNGQYVKGVVHALIFALLFAVSTSSHEDAIHALLIPLIIFFELYMPIEAVRTAQAVRRGEPVDELSGIAGALVNTHGDSPVPGIVFITLGVFLLLFTLGILQVDVVLRGWPLLLIAFGAWRLYASVQSKDSVPERRTPGGYPLDDLE
jgi:TM2 domain-containing membrane protein YozV